jgi:hypothetical protein
MNGPRRFRRTDEGQTPKVGARQDFSEIAGCYKIYEAYTSRMRIHVEFYDMTTKIEIATLEPESHKTSIEHPSFAVNKQGEIVSLC